MKLIISLIGLLFTKSVIEIVAAQDNETLPRNSIEIGDSLKVSSEIQKYNSFKFSVFVHELNQEDFLSSVDKIIEPLKRDIKFKKIPNSQESILSICELNEQLK